MDALTPYFALSDIPGHISYAVLAISYCLTNIYWLRVAAVIGLAFEIIYFSMTSTNLYTGIGWGLIFIVPFVYRRKKGDTKGRKEED